MKISMFSSLCNCGLRNFRPWIWPILGKFKVGVFKKVSILQIFFFSTVDEKSTFVNHANHIPLAGIVPCSGISRLICLVLSPALELVDYSAEFHWWTNTPRNLVLDKPNNPVSDYHCCPKQPPLFYISSTDLWIVPVVLD